MIIKPTLLGHVGAVTGSSVSVRQASGIASGIAIIGGKSYRVGQVGSFVRIPQGYHDLYGIVAEIGVQATPADLRQNPDRGERWMTVQLVGEIINASFERGISQYPSLNDEVHLVTEEDLLRIYGAADYGQVAIGRLANAEGIAVRINLDTLVTRHSAVLGSTGSGKSTTVASLLRSIARGHEGRAAEAFPSARILVLDVHGEYGRALQDVSAVFKVGPSDKEQPLYVPFWALDPPDLLEFLMGRLDDRPLTQVIDRIFAYKNERAQAETIPGVDLTSMTADTPVPFSLKRLWYELLDPEVKTWADNQRTIPAMVDRGDANTLVPPRYQPHSTTNTPPFLNSVGMLGIRRALDQMRSRLLDPQYSFLLRPGPWEPDLNGRAERDLSDLLKAWLGHDNPITILDLSGIPSVVLVRLIGGILRIVCESLTWGREKSEGGTRRPVLVVMEEAHRYLSVEQGGPARTMVQRVVKEGRKFGIGAMIVSQRPSEVDETILSQCGTFVALRLSNATDRSRVQASLSDSLAGIVDSLPVLRTGEAIIIGEATRIPIRCRITLPIEEHRPASEDPEVSANWRRPRIGEGYSRVVASWRAQNPRWATQRIDRTKVQGEDNGEMERVPVTSEAVVSAGYDAASETLEIELIGGRVYQYYQVPATIYEQLMAADSKGKFFNFNIKNAYAYSQV